MVADPDRLAFDPRQSLTHSRHLHTCRCGASHRSRSFLTKIQAGVADEEIIGQISGPQPVIDANKLVTDHPTMRFAIAAFDSWPEAEKALHALSAGGKALNNVSYLAQERVLGGAKASNSRPTVHLFGETGRGIGCSAGPVADRLTERLASGATTLQAALGRWLIARHAANLQQAVVEGKILLWVQLFDNDDERRAYQSLLATSSNSVGVHDLVEVGSAVRRA